MLESIMRLCKINQVFAIEEDGCSRVFVTLSCLDANYYFLVWCIVDLSVVHIWFIKIIKIINLWKTYMPDVIINVLQSDFLNLHK